MVWPVAECCGVRPVAEGWWVWPVAEGCGVRPVADGCGVWPVAEGWWVWPSVVAAIIGEIAWAMQWVAMQHR